MSDLVKRLRHEACATSYKQDKPWDLLMDAADEIERLRASPWMPIETAPMDGKPVLLGWRHWSSGDWEYEAAPAGNIDVAREGCRSCHGFATHWMPLPIPPLEEQQP